ncbi:hypothetical protein [Salipiger aestuarii]|uniref:hypothetical protein n=1 Tax=Salipiger aestuarii TaxID=568098 RepID=UPI00123A742B|nr:hypothetical protein [Salipiger aestuarii]KAA8610003.1 hypothetical protein AL037_14190 [Salipiger aestuarii]
MKLSSKLDVFLGSGLAVDRWLRRYRPRRSAFRNLRAHAEVSAAVTSLPKPARNGLLAMATPAKT